MSRDDPVYARVSPRFWPEAQAASWTDDMKMLGLYLLTCEHRTTEGLYRLPVEYMAADLSGDDRLGCDLAGSWSTERVSVSLAPLVAQGFAQYDHAARVVLLPKAMKYQRPDNGNQQTAAIKRLRNLPPTTLSDAFFEAAKEFAPAFYEALHKAFPQGLVQGYGNPKALAIAKAIDQEPSSKSASTDAATSVDNSPKSVKKRTDYVVPFEKWWAVYGRYGSKVDALDCYKHWRKKGASESDLLKAAAAYVKHCEKTDTTIKHAATFLAKRLNRWSEWISETHGDPNGKGNGKVEIAKKPACPVCETDLTFDERQRPWCPMCERNPLDVAPRMKGIA